MWLFEQLFYNPGWCNWNGVGNTTELIQLLPRWNKEIVFLHRPADFEVLLHGWQHSKTACGNAQPPKTNDEPAEFAKELRTAMTSCGSVHNEKSPEALFEKRATHATCRTLRRWWASVSICPSTKYVTERRLSVGPIRRTAAGRSDRRRTT